MFRAKILIPAITVIAGLFYTTSDAQAQVGVSVQIGRGYRPPVYRPAPVYVAPVPYVAPIPYPVYRPAPVVVPVHDHCFRVMFRDCAQDPWQTFRVFHNHDRAHETVALLRQRGLEAYVAHD